MNTRWMLNGAALAAVVLASLSTAAMADRGSVDRMGMDGPFPLFDFARVDADKDGKVTRAELAAFRAARLTEVDTDKDGKLSPAELKAQAMQRAAERADDMVARMVKRLDSDGDGMISTAEMAAGPAPKDLCDRIDRDGDGAISQAEAEAARKFIARHIGRRHGQGGPEDGGQVE